VTDRETFRLGPPVVFWWVWVAFVAVNALDYAVQGLPSARFGAVVGAVLLLVTGLAFTLALRPKVITSGDGITVVNPYRTHFVPWRLVTFVDTGEWVQVHYAPAGSPGAGSPGAGMGATVHCWALYVSTRARRKIASGPPRPRAQRGLAGLGRGLVWGAGGRGGGRRRAPPPRRPPASPRRPGTWPPSRPLRRWPSAWTREPTASGPARLTTPTITARSRR
jgi:Bacterial PH domain